MTDTQTTGGTFLVCIDSSDEAKAALRFACMKAERTASSVLMLHVIEPMADVQSLFSLADRMRQERAEEAAALLEDYVAIAKDISSIVPTPLIKEGRLGEVILKVAMEDANINIVVLGATPTSAGRGRLVTWMASQLGDKLMVPLMLVPGMLTEQQLRALI